MLEYKGYIGKYEIDTDANIIHGEVDGIKDVITFQAKTVEDLKTAFHESVDDYLTFCNERGEEPYRPYSGKLVVRIKPEIHKMLYLAAKRGNVSMNSIIEKGISQVLHK